MTTLSSWSFSGVFYGSPVGHRETCKVINCQAEGGEYNYRLYAFVSVVFLCAL